MSDLSGLLRGTANLIDAVTDAYREQRTGFADRESGDYLDTAGLDDAVLPEDEDQVMRLALKLYRIRELAEGWRYKGEFGWGPWQEGHGPDPEGQVLDQVATKLLEILNEGINFWTPPVAEADDVVDAEVHCEGCKCPSICGCGRELYSEPESPDGPLFWFHRDDDSPITLECTRIRDGLTSPAAADGCGRSGGADLDTVSAEARRQQQGDRPADFDAVTAAYRAVMEWIERPDADPRRGLTGCTPAMVAGVAINAYRAALLSVGHDDLAAHITAISNAWRSHYPMSALPLSEEIARDLLCDYRITKK